MMSSVKPKRHLIIARPNAGLEAAYRSRLVALIREMSDDVSTTLQQTYSENRPRIAQDATPAQRLRAAMRRLAKKWLKRFDDAAPGLADHFARGHANRTDDALKAALRKAGFTVRWSATATQRDVLQATIGEQVGLIKSIGADYLSGVEGIVMRSVQMGQDMGYLAGQLQERYGVTTRRAALIAKDQTNKAVATMTRVRQLELSPDAEAIWQHSHGGRHPRPSHVAANGKRYKVRQGMLIDGEYIWPGQLINCRCLAGFYVEGLT